MPRKIIFLNKILEYDINCQDYNGLSEIGSRALFSYLFRNKSTQNFINDRVEILEDNTEEIEELDEEWTYIEGQVGKIWSKSELELVKKINELTKAVNELKKVK